MFYMFISHCCLDEALIIAIIEDFFDVEEHGNVLPLTATLINNHQEAVLNINVAMQLR